IVRPDVDRLRAERRKLVQQLLAVFHVGVVGLVVSEVSPRRLEGTLGRSAVNTNGHLSAQRQRKQERRSTQITRHGLIVAQAAGKLKTSVADVREFCGAAPWRAFAQTFLHAASRPGGRLRPRGAAPPKNLSRTSADADRLRAWLRACATRRHHSQRSALS